MPLPPNSFSTASYINFRRPNLFIFINIWVLIVMIFVEKLSRKRGKEMINKIRSEKWRNFSVTVFFPLCLSIENRCNHILLIYAVIFFLGIFSYLTSLVLVVFMPSIFLCFISDCYDSWWNHRSLFLIVYFSGNSEYF